MDKILYRYFFSPLLALRSVSAESDLIATYISFVDRPHKF